MLPSILRLYQRWGSSPGDRGSKKVKLATLVKGDPKTPFSIATTPKEGTTPFPGLLHFTLDPYLIMLSAKQGGIKHHFLSLWYDSTGDWTPVSQTIGECSIHYKNKMLY